MRARRVAGADPARMAHEKKLDLPERVDGAAGAASKKIDLESDSAARSRLRSDAEDSLKRRHPEIETAVDDLKAGRLGRRGFMRLAALLGAGAGVAGYFATDIFGQGGAPRAEPAASDGPRRGGRLVCAMPVEAVGDPAQFDWVAKSNLLRHQNEHLTFTGADNITLPMLAEGWAASDDLKTWTFRLRESAYWRSGARFTAEDVRFNFTRWFDPAVGSSNAALFAALPGPEAVEIVDVLTFRLHLSTPSLSVPESLYNYPTAMMPRNFEGDVGAAVAAGVGVDGTGPYELKELVPGERAVLVRARNSPRYWGADAPYIGAGLLDEIVYAHHETVGDGAMEVVLSGAADMAYEIDVADAETATAAGGVVVHAADSAQTGCIRMRTDIEPFTDLRVRRALQVACDPAVFPERVFAGRGRPGEHHHVAQIHPDYFPLPRLRRDVTGARAALTSAGYPDGIDLTLKVGATSGAWEIRSAELFAEQVAEAGVRVVVDRVSADEYRRIWKTTPFGLTQWTHRPLGTMALALGYRSGAAWNESAYANPEFDAALAEAEAIIDIRARRRAMRPVERMLQRDAPIVQPVWTPIMSLASARVRGFEAQPTRYHHFNKVWLAE